MQTATISTVTGRLFGYARYALKIAEEEKGAQPVENQ
jgi:hypothetical protein